MPSEDEDSRYDQNTPRMKRRGRACDLCRYKKVRCDGQLGERCSNCAAGQRECTYVKEAKKRYPYAERIRALELELANYKKLLNKLHPGVDFSRELSGILSENSLWLLDGKAGSNSSGNPLQLPTLPIANSPAAPTEDADSTDDELSAHLETRKRMSALTLHSDFPRYVGKSSRFMFYKQAYDLRNSFAGIDTPGVGALFSDRLKMSLNRNQYLRSQPWILHALEPPPVSNYIFPPEDLMNDLVELYFDRINSMLPLLHRPTFNSCIVGALHHEDDGFAAVLLLVCACGARFSKDNRVLAEGSDNWHSAGWKWFIQVQTTRREINLRSPRLYDLQIPSLVNSYLLGSCISHPSWLQTGLGMRLAQDMGAHRRKSYGNKPTIESELMRRAFWCLVMFDRSLSFSLGRPCSIEEEDMDVEFPIECDDEYWTHPDPEQAFKQPADKPSIITFFNVALKLKQIHAFALRTLYSTKKSRVHQGKTGPQWEQHIISEIDSSLNQWVDSVPDHLRWDPHKEDWLILRQSAYLYSSYYFTQINIHRAFIPSPRKSTTVSFPSLAICTNAARSCIHVLEVEYRRGVGDYHNSAGLFSSAIVLLLNIWGCKKSGTSINAAKELAEVHKAMEILKGLEEQWYVAGKYWEVLFDLASVGELPLPHPAPNQKRQRGEDSTPAQSRPTPENRSLVSGQRSIAGSKRALAYQNSVPVDLPATNEASVFSPNIDFVLPIHSDELGRMPIFPPQPVPQQTMTSSLSEDTWNPFDMAPSIFGSTTLDVGSSNVPTLEPVSLSSASDAEQLAQTLAADPAAQFQSTETTSLPPMAQSLGSTPLELDLTGSGFTLPTTPNGSGDISEDLLSMWMTAPEGFEWDEWEVFISSMDLSAHDGS